MKTTMKFEILSGDTVVRTETFIQDILKVGKLPSSHLRIEDEDASRMHSVIEVTGPEEIYIIDLGSAAGTIVNDVKLGKSRLKSGDVLRFGKTRVRFLVGE